MSGNGNGTDDEHDIVIVLVLVLGINRPSYSSHATLNDPIQYVATLRTILVIW